jgi:tetratricopeptide (TPR) repeat protein
MTKKNVFKIKSHLAVSFAILISHFFAEVSLAKDVPNSELMQEIEQSLIFDKDSRSRSEVYQRNQSLRKSDYVISAGKTIKSDNKDKKEQEIKIVVVDTKAENFDLRAKEKLAYNAIIIGQYEVAIELYKQVLKVEPNNHYSKFALAVVYQKIGQTRQAKNIYRELLKSNPENREEIIGNLLAVLIEESPKDSIYLLSRLTAQNPSSSYILAQAAIAYDKIHKSEEALLLMRSASEIDPSNLEYKYNLAVMNDKASKIEEALVLYDDILQQYSSSNSDNSNISIVEVEARVKTIKSQL